MSACVYNTKLQRFIMNIEVKKQGGAKKAYIGILGWFCFKIELISKQIQFILTASTYI